MVLEVLALSSASSFKNLAQNDQDVDIQFKSGGSYKGCILNNCKSGKGIFHWPDGCMYQGGFLNNERAGQGQQLYRDGSFYEGQFLNDMREGKGKQTYSNGEYYDGGFFKDFRHGYGKYFWPEGTDFDGMFYTNKKEGYGTLAFANGNVFQGLYKDDDRKGPGILTYKDSSLQDVGLWHGEKLIRIGFHLHGAFSLAQHPHCVRTSQNTPTTINMADCWIPFSKLNQLCEVSNYYDVISKEKLSKKMKDIYITYQDPSSLKINSEVFNGSYISQAGGRFDPKETRFLWNTTPSLVELQKHILKHTIKQDLIKVEEILQYSRDFFQEKGPLEVCSEMLLKASLMGDADLVESILEESAAHPDVGDKQGTNALINAAAIGHSGIINSLLNHGANINQLNDEGCSALTIGIILNYPPETFQKAIQVQRIGHLPNYNIGRDNGKSLPCLHSSSRRSSTSKIDEEDIDIDIVPLFWPENSKDTDLEDLEDCQCLQSGTSSLQNAGFVNANVITKPQRSAYSNAIQSINLPQGETPSETKPQRRVCSNSIQMRNLSQGETPSETKPQIILHSSGLPQGELPMKMNLVQHIPPTVKTFPIYSQEFSKPVRKTNEMIISTRNSPLLTLRGTDVSSTKPASKETPVVDEIFTHRNFQTSTSVSIRLLPNQNTQFETASTNIPNIASEAPVRERLFSKQSSETEGQLTQMALFKNSNVRETTEQWKDSYQKDVKQQSGNVGLVSAMNKERDNFSKWSNDISSLVNWVQKDNFSLNARETSFADFNKTFKNDEGRVFMARENRFRKCVNLLLKRGADPNASCLPWPALFFAIRAADVPMVKMLLLRYSSTSVRLSDREGGLTPLHIACGMPGNEGIEMTKLLLNSLADPDARAAWDLSYINPTLMEEWQNDVISEESKALLGGRTPLHIACARDDNYEDAATIVRMLLENRANPNLLCNGFSPLALAIAWNNCLAVDELLNHGADPSLPLTHGVGSILCVAASTQFEEKWTIDGGRVHLINKLLKAGANILAPIPIGPKRLSGTVVDYVYMFNLDFRIANVNYHALTSSERVTYKTRKEMLVHLGVKLREAAINQEKQRNILEASANIIYPSTSSKFVYTGADDSLAKLLNQKSKSKEDSKGVNFVTVGKLICNWRGHRSQSETQSRKILFKYCYECGRSVNVQLKPCSRCRAIFYCSKVCKLKAWQARHRDECIRIEGTGKGHLSRSPKKSKKLPVVPTTTSVKGKDQRTRDVKGTTAQHNGKVSSGDAINIWDENYSYE